MAYAGAKRLVDYQDTAYAAEYLALLSNVQKADAEAGGAERGFSFTVTAAKYLAVAMAYDDVIRVADLKTRGERMQRIRDEIGMHDAQVVNLTEYMHPRLEEIVGLLPAKLGRAIEARPRIWVRLDRLVNRGRRVKSAHVSWFLLLYGIAGLKFLRRGMLRHEREVAHLTRWLDLACTLLPRNYELAVAVLATRRLVKGYSDTHARGLSKFDRVLSAVPNLVPHADGGAWLRRLIEAALLDEQGKALDGALLTAASAHQPV